MKSTKGPRLKVSVLQASRINGSHASFHSDCLSLHAFWRTSVNALSHWAQVLIGDGATSPNVLNISAFKRWALSFMNSISARFLSLSPKTFWNMRKNGKRKTLTKISFSSMYMPAKQIKWIAIEPQFMKMLKTGPKNSCVSNICMIQNPKRGIKSSIDVRTPIADR